MNANATKTPTLAAINAYAVSRYGHDVLTVDQTCAMWIAEHFGSFAAWKRIANARAKAGLGMTFPAFKSACWA